ncbi:DUF3820 family protein [Mucilaginibacter sp. ZT4R22]|uniref:DUF3820 family protein n=1 Tax=Mucilaginibacter pankratovii TaxID=2772110 RepID=A0ABR7WYG6_9SPHI|nr:DUF3820 family protein [Mucilaginibacter pankratovii]MBD1367320.1 DUF3820 family protein [Mucilaginibacter pankratovii]
MENVNADPQILVDIVKTRMPFGKYKDTLISDIPISYLEWMQRKGFPPGKLGMLMSTAYEIKLNGLDKLLWMIKAGKR